MKVKLTTDRAGLGWEQHEGDELELSPAEAEVLIASGQAELAEEQTPVPPPSRPKKRSA